MEFAAYIYDAWAYEQANQELQELPQLVDLRLRFQRASAIAIASLGLYSGMGLQPLVAKNILEPSVNTAPWCNHLYLCDTSYILEVQNLLARRGFDVGAIDGVYGHDTKQAVIDFQRTQAELAVDGIPGAETLRLLQQTPTRSVNPPSPSNPVANNPVNNNGDRRIVIVRNNSQSNETQNPRPSLSEEVGSLQILLKQRGFYLGEVDGIQGQSTINAVIKAQQAYGISQDGFAGPMTTKALLAGGSDVVLNQPLPKRSPNSQELTELQNLLRERGFYEGANSGIYDIRTRDSILKAQRAYAQLANGEFAPELLVALKGQKNLNSNNPTNNRVPAAPTNSAAIQNPNSQSLRSSPSAATPNSQTPISSQNLPIPPTPAPAAPS